MKRYQLYLNPQTVGIIDEAAEVGSLNRSEIMRQMVDGAAARVGNLLAVLKPPEKADYSWWKTGTTVAGDNPGKKVNLSQNVDGIYYR